MPYFRLHILAIFLCFTFVSYSQQDVGTIIKLNNPSFNGNPGPSRAFISGWVDCGRSRFPTETAPDLQPGSFLVNLAPKEGKAYLGMVARDNSTWESVTQLLRKPLEASKCYSFSLHLAVSAKYSSPARTSGIAIEEADAKGVALDSIQHTTPIVLRIWGGKDQCEMTELIGETEEIKNRSWKKFDFKFEPKSELNFIMLEAYYKTPTLFPANGHILIDDLSEIVGVPCKMGPPIVKITSPRQTATTNKLTYKVKANLQNVYSKKDILFKLNNKMFTDFEYDTSSGDLTASIPLREGLNKFRIKGTNTEGENEASSTVKYREEEIVVAEVTPAKVDPENNQTTTQALPSESSLEGVKRSDLKKDLKLQIKNIAFQADSIRIQEKYQDNLLKIVSFLNSNEDVIIEIGGHTNNSCDEIICIELSENRANSVMNFLVEKGANRSQLKSKGYGSKEPIKSNNSSYGRRQNQRVEIKIIDIDN